MSFPSNILDQSYKYTDYYHTFNNIKNSLDYSLTYHLALEFKTPKKSSLECLNYASKCSTEVNCP